MTSPLQSGYRVTVEPARRIFGGRNQWKFGIRRIENGEPIDPRDTYANQGELIGQIEKLLGSADAPSPFPVPVELVVLDRQGNVEERRRIR